MPNFILVWITPLFLLQASGESPISTLFQQAQQDLWAARYQSAAALYSRVLSQDSTYDEAYYGLVHSLIKAHRSQEAYATADDALLKNAASPFVQTAAGLAAWRRGDLSTAEEHFRAALKVHPDYPGALEGLASVYAVVSRFKSARELLAKAYRSWPDDPDLMIAHANTLKGSDHIAELERVLAVLDSESEEARSLRAHIADDRAIGERKTRRLVSPYVQSKVKLLKLSDGPLRLRGFGLQVRLNEKENVRLLLDTGASGISVSPKIATKAGLETLGGEILEIKGIGDDSSPTTYRYLASKIRVGDVEFADFPISVFRSAKTSDYDGLIGADVFQRFIVTIDFPQFEIALEPRQTDPSSISDEAIEAGAPAPGFHRMFRFGNHLAVPTFVNERTKTSLFLIDSGANVNLMDTETAQASTKTHRDEQTIVKGIQGKVNQTLRADRISLVFAGFRQDNPNLITISLEKMSDSMGVAFGGIIGIPVLGNLSVAIDYREGTVRFDYRR